MGQWGRAVRRGAGKCCRSYVQKFSFWQNTTYNHKIFIAGVHLHLSNISFGGWEALHVRLQKKISKFVYVAWVSFTNLGLLFKYESIICKLKQQKAFARGCINQFGIGLNTWQTNKMGVYVTHVVTCTHNRNKLCYGRGTARRAIISIEILQIRNIPSASGTLGYACPRLARHLPRQYKRWRHYTRDVGVSLSAHLPIYPPICLSHITSSKTSRFTL